MKKRILALVLVLALFVAVFSVSAFAAYDKKGIREENNQKDMPGTIFYWIDVERNVGICLVDRDHSMGSYAHMGGAHLRVLYSWNYDYDTDTTTYRGKGLFDTTGFLVFGWATPDVPAER